MSMSEFYKQHQDVGRQNHHISYNMHLKAAPARDEKSIHFALFALLLALGGLRLKNV